MLAPSFTQPPTLMSTLAFFGAGISYMAQEEPDLYRVELSYPAYFFMKEYAEVLKKKGKSWIQN